MNIIDSIVGTAAGQNCYKIGIEAIEQCRVVRHYEIDDSYELFMSSYRLGEFRHEFRFVINRPRPEITFNELIESLHGCFKFNHWIKVSENHFHLSKKRCSVWQPLPEPPKEDRLSFLELLDMAGYEEASVINLSKGNPGAIRVLFNCMKVCEDFKREVCFPLDMMDLKGDMICVLFKNVCKENLQDFIDIIKASEKGMISKEELVAASTDGPDRPEIDHNIILEQFRKSEG